MNIDLHTHTYPASSCSRITYRDFVAECRRLDVGAVALTNHGNVSDNRKLEKPLADDGITLVHGVEISTWLGDFVVYSPDLDWLSQFRDVQEPPLPEQIADHAAVVWAHPAAGGGRSRAAYSSSQVRMAAPIVSAVEVRNGQWLGADYVNTARAIAEQLGVAMTGGSDAHAPGRIMTCYTEFAGEIRGTADVVAALKARTTVPRGEPVKTRRRFRLFG
jgi:predicted metal-dependent phosphoesterase TrpH